MTTFAALGDSITPGVGDPAPGGGWRGWAAFLADSLPGGRLVNLAANGARVADVERTQLPRALELRPDVANAFLATKISFINAMAELCEVTGADVLTLAGALGHDRRIGAAGMRPGLGFGGGCLPKDIRALAARAAELGAGEALGFLHEIDAINQRRRTRVVDLAREAAGGRLEGRRVGVLGVAFKPGSDDIRDSPALEVAARIRALGARVAVFDPAAMDRARKVHPDLDYTGSMLGAARGADVLLVLTEWPEFAAADPEVLAKTVGRRAVVDARHALDADAWRGCGWDYRAPGRPGSAPPARAAGIRLHQAEPHEAAASFLAAAV